MSDRGLYKVQTVARLVGFSPAVLRTWENRYDFLLPERTERGHRLYTQQDLLVLRAVKRLIDEGLNVGEIAQIGRHQLLQGSNGGPSERTSEAPDAVMQWLERAMTSVREADGEALLESVNQALLMWTPEFLVCEVMGRLNAMLRAEPANLAPLAKMAERTLAFRAGNLLLGAARLGGYAPRAVCCAFPGEHEELPALAGAYLLARHGWRVAYLGASVSFADVEAAVGRFRPEIVFMSLTRSMLYLVHSASVARLSLSLPDPGGLWLAGEGVERSDGAAFVQLPGLLKLESLKRQVDVFRSQTAVPR